MTIAAAHAALTAGDVAAARRHLAAADPAHPHTRQIEAGVLMSERRFGEAAPLLEALARDYPMQHAALFNLGICLFELGRFEDAAACHRRALLLEPSHAKTWLKLAACLAPRQLWHEAEACYRRAVALDPNDAELRIGFGTMLSYFDNNTGAEEQYLRALKLNPDAWEAKVALGFVLLRQGYWQEGFAWFEHRWKLPLFATRAQGLKPWMGDPLDLDGKRVVVACEQGFGDTIQFGRYVTEVSLRAHKVWLLGPIELKRLMVESLPLDGYVVEGVEPIPEHDILTSLMSLPGIFGGKIIPPVKPFLKPRPVGARIGVCWHGGARPHDPLAHADDQRRSIPLDMFQQVIDAAAPAGVVSLQQEDLTGWGCRDWHDTAEIVAGLDLVVTVDTAVAHLAASLGVETWLLIRRGGCWRWLSEGRSTVWYPSVTLYRQEILSDWPGAVARVAADVRAWVKP